MKRKILKPILIILLIGLFIIQFFPTEKNTGVRYGANDYTNAIEVPADVKNLIENACMDCHSNHTNNVWYQNIQPIGWWMNNHVNEGKEELNFSEFNTYKIKRKAHKLEEIAEQIEKGEMPPGYYTIMHSSAKLNENQMKTLINWAENEMKKLKASE
ncbi:MAG: heme-binding domain-containing protein [Bacteroidota bacterium]|jgi:cytochrome c551/c552